MYILGINAYHADASACILNDEILIAAAEEEKDLEGSNIKLVFQKKQLNSV